MRPVFKCGYIFIKNRFERSSVALLAGDFRTLQCRDCRLLVEERRAASSNESRRSVHLPAILRRVGHPSPNRWRKEGLRTLNVVIMPCLDIKDGRVVKGVQFVDLRDAGDPVEAARAYEADGADALAFLDITATVEKRPTTLRTIAQVASAIAIPLTVGGGIRSVDDARQVFDAGATRISISSAAFRSPDLVDQTAKAFGSERVVVAIDVDRSSATPSGYEVYIDGGRTPTGTDAIEWAISAVQRGAGMLLPTSKACDGAKEGYDLPLIRHLREAVSVPIVASGGAGTMDHFLQASQAGADVLLAASVFHFGEVKISELKAYLTTHGVTFA